MKKTLADPDACGKRWVRCWRIQSDPRTVSVVGKVWAMEPAVKMRPLTRDRYAKSAFRKKQAVLPFPEKVHQIVALQERLRPIYAARGRVIVPWKID